MGQSPGKRANASSLNDMINGKKPSLKFNALSNMVSLAVNVVTGLYITRIVFGGLDPTSFGMWMLTSSVVGYFSLLQFGVGTGIMRYVPLYRGQKRLDDVSMTVSTAMAFYTVTGLLILALSFLLSGMLADFFNGGPMLARLIKIMGLAVALECPSYIYDAVLRSHERFVIGNAVVNFKAVVKAVVIWWCLHLGYGVVGLSWSLVAVNVVMLIVADIVFRRACSDVRLSFRLMRFSHVKILSGYSVWIAIASIADTLTFGSAKAIIGKMVSIPAVGPWGNVAQLSNYHRRTTYAITRVFMPRFSFLQGSQSHDAIRRLFMRATLYVTSFTGLTAVILWTLGPAFMILWLKKDISYMTPVLMVLVGGMLVLCSNRLVVDMLYGLGKQRVLACFSTAEGLTVLALSIWLVRFYGVLGVAIGIAVPIAIMRGIVQPYYACRLANLSLWHYYGHRILRLWLVIGGLSAALVWLNVGAYATTWIRFFIASVLIAVVYSVIVYAMAVGKEDRASIRKNVRAWLSSRRPVAAKAAKAEPAIQEMI
jgi:O-antigen/teichoic acid export membrane protein